MFRGDIYYIVWWFLLQELCKVTKQRMLVEIKDKIVRLQEDSITFQLARGM